MTEKKNRTWVYHAEKKPKIVNMTTGEIEALEADGWERRPVEQNAAVEENDRERDELLDQFHDDPSMLSKDQIVMLGRYLGVKMMKAWPADTLINKVRSGLE